ncbi:MAG: ABC transporter ATP-binding protein [Elusimicrobia bacterium]|nr:ABC transporter ATP-binding protein [Elusimicrobiota bacterium]
MKPVLEARGVWKVYESGVIRVEAVRGADLAVARGEFVAVMGPSGSGKTTLLSMLGAMLTPTKGSILVEGEDISRLGPEELSRLRRRRIGFVFQAFNLFAALTAKQNVELGLRLRGRPARDTESEALRALDAVGLSERADFPPADLSGGEKQRVSIARALAGGPQFILADEPTGALDAVNGRAVMELLAERARKAGAAVVVVTHDLRVAQFMDRVVLMEDGRLTAGAHPRGAPAGGL